MRKPFSWLIAILASCMFTNYVSAGQVNFSIEGTVVKVEPTKSIIVQIKKSRSIELNLADINTLAIVDPKKLNDGVVLVATIGGISGGVGNVVGVVSPPKSLQRSRLKDASLTGVVAAGFSALAKVFFNQVTKKPPILVFDADSASLNNPAVIANLPVGTKIKVTQKNIINSTS